MERRKELIQKLKEYFEKCEDAAMAILVESRNIGYCYFSAVLLL